MGKIRHHARMVHKQLEADYKSGDPKAVAMVSGLRGEINAARKSLGMSNFSQTSSHSKSMSSKFLLDGHCFAEFNDIGNPPRCIRKDTRVYFEPKAHDTKPDGECVGTVLMCNPGSASPLVSLKWNLIQADQTLKVIVGIIEKVGSSPEPVGQNDAIHDAIARLQKPPFLW